MAFQIVDDVLDLTASESVLGKPVASDLREGKVTMAVIYALERCTPEEREKIAIILRDRAFNGVTHADILGNSESLWCARGGTCPCSSVRGRRTQGNLYVPRFGDQARPAVGAGVRDRSREVGSSPGRGYLKRLLRLKAFLRVLCGSSPRPVRFKVSYPTQDAQGRPVHSSKRAAEAHRK